MSPRCRNSIRSGAYETVNRELASYNEENLATETSEFVVATEIDALTIRKGWRRCVNAPRKMGKPFFAISSATNNGVRELINACPRSWTSWTATGRSRMTPWSWPFRRR